MQAVKHPHPKVQKKKSVNFSEDKEILLQQMVLDRIGVSSET